MGVALTVAVTVTVDVAEGAGGTDVTVGEKNGVLSAVILHGGGDVTPDSAKQHS